MVDCVPIHMADLIVIAIKINFLVNFVKKHLVLVTRTHVTTMRHVLQMAIRTNANVFMAITEKTFNSRYRLK